MQSDLVMNCKEYQEKIYLYSEITEMDKTSLREHMRSCEDCRELFESVTEVQRLTTIVAAREIRPSDASKFTHKIMEGIVSDRNQVGWEQIIIRMHSGMLRYAFASVSTLLIFVLVYENYPQPRPQQNKEPLLVARVFLSSSAWRERLAARREKKAVCSSPFLSTPDRLLCLKNKLIAAKP